MFPCRIEEEKEERVQFASTPSSVTWRYPPSFLLFVRLKNSVAARRTSKMLRTDQLFFFHLALVCATCVLLLRCLCCVVLLGRRRRKKDAATETERSGAGCTARLVVHVQSLLHLAFFFSFLTTIELSPSLQVNTSFKMATEQSECLLTRLVHDILCRIRMLTLVIFLSFAIFVSSLVVQPTS